jgi:DnaJ domain
MMTPPPGDAGSGLATIGRMDPHGVLGLPPTATPEEIAATYRRLAKESHPDRGGGAARMAEINAAYELLRATAWTSRHEPPAPQRSAPENGRGDWLPPAIRRALGHELLGVLEPGERIWLVTPTTTWASPQALLAAGEDRLLWLLDDAVSGRVQSLRFAAIEMVEHTLRRPRKRVATLRVRARSGRRFAFGDLRPATAAALTGRIAAACDGSARRP